MTVDVPQILENLALGRDLTTEEADGCFALLFDGELTPAQAGALLMGLRAKGETAAEVAAAVRQELQRARLVKGFKGKTIDTCGTGGDGACTFNCSTAVALFLADMGYQVTKHGNRAVSSQCGSADAVEGLGFPLLGDPEDVVKGIEAQNFAFLFAPGFHPAFKHIMPVRMELRMRTLFNILGPLLNPARPTHQIVGVANPQIQDLMAEVLLLTGIEKAAVVHGAGGVDELTAQGPATVVWVAEGNLVRTELDPAAFGFKPSRPEDVAVGDKEDALGALRALFAGKGKPAMQDMAALNLGLCLHLLEDGMPLGEAMDRARAKVAKGLDGVLAEAI